MSISVEDVGSVDIFVVLLFIILIFLMFLNEEENDDDANEEKNRQALPGAGLLQLWSKLTRFS